ncbi:MAG: FAD-dependent oxidoreductase [Candidatus Omnitrophica bacterium]|nr:FAD-dependent oxidoreductase [Candidatus Omnitrophota bacterium]MBU1128353.1 FAD-dependent oxidoreductase [Candidatus Omnitrophota bacterium]MBU1657376.1 FAD-dependent oxidoreductase [Candidatus Omnitrophota bacterium]MBU1784773.1 FAD-dependent oxidoreductase [Candidatus Omnitrophota bacterium]MBU1851844.1 FAD-dependent oxidoreductase [Candidatus Omnitrophota bacterium]
MSKKTDILILGAGPAGMVSAAVAHKYYPSKKITIIKSIDKGVIPCGIPYMFSSLKDPDENKLSTQPLENKGIEVVVDEAVKIDRSRKTVITACGNEYSYEKLILAVGSDPIKPCIPGIDKKGVYLAYKDMEYLKKAISEIKGHKNVLILGGGFIGVEFADEIAKIKSINVYLAEVLPRILANSFDEEFSSLAEDRLKNKGVKLMTGSKVVEIAGKDKVEKICFENGSDLFVESVILGIGAVPNTKLAAEAELDLGRGKGIWVDEYMRTTDPDIFAVGDCAGKRDFYTRKDAPVMLASTATAEARIAGANLYSVKVVREIKGTIAIYSTYLNGLVLGSAGLTEGSAKKEGFEIVAGNAEGIDKHPGSLPGAGKIKLKLIFSKQSGIIMGGQVAGGISAGEMINIIGMAIQQRVSVTELETLQVATHPYLTSAPTMYPVVLAAQDASGKMLM